MIFSNLVKLFRMDFTPEYFILMDSEFYYYHLDIQPTDIIVNYQSKQLIIQDHQETLPTRSAALQLVCIAQDKKIPIQIISNDWKNTFIIDGIYIGLFIKTVEKAYPLLAKYLQTVCYITQQ